MRYYKYIFLLFALILVSCAQKKQQVTTNADLAKEAQSVFKQALADEKAGLYWSSIDNYDKAIKIYQQADSSALRYYSYLAYRFRANMLNKVDLDSTAARSIDLALRELKKSTFVPANTTKEAQEIGALRYKASYLREAGKYGQSNDLLISLLQAEEVVPDMALHIKNLIGMNFRDLGDMPKALEYFNDILKKDEIDPKLKPYYLNNRSYVAYHTGRKELAYKDIGEAIGIVSTLQMPQAEMLFRMNLGEYQMMDGQYLEADENFARALSAFNLVDDAPELFKIYRLRAVASAAVGDLQASNASYLKYDELEKANALAIKRYNGRQELAILEAKLAGLKIEEERAAWLAELKLSRTAFFTMAVLMAVVIGFTMLVIAAWKRKAEKFSTTTPNPSL